MPDPLDIQVNIKGPLFATRIDEATKRVILEDVFDKVDQRVMRQPRSPKLGRKNNTLEARRTDRGREASLTVTSTRHWPRTKGTAWLRYNIGAVKKIAPNVIRKAGRRLAEELGGK